MQISFPSILSICRKKGILFELIPERLRGDIARFEIATKSGKVIVQKDKRITVKHVREMQQAGIDKLAVPEDFLLGRVLAPQRRG